jgi:hypothetical protein
MQSGDERAKHGGIDRNNGAHKRHNGGGNGERAQQCSSGHDGGAHRAQPTASITIVAVALRTCRTL